MKLLIIINQCHEPSGMDQSFIVIHRDLGPDNYDLVSAGRDQLAVGDVDFLVLHAIVHC